MSEASGRAAFAFAPWFDLWTLSQVRIFTSAAGAFLSGNALVSAMWTDLLHIHSRAAEGECRMDGIERDSDVTINLGFGNITFYRDEAGAYAHAVVDLPMMVDGDKRQNQIQAELRFSCSPATDSVERIVEMSRQQLLMLLRAATSHLEDETAEGLLYRQEAADPAG